MSTPTLEPGFPRPFGPYLLLRSFGRGGMGEVFLAGRDTGGAVQLAVVKTLRRELGGNREYMRRFMDETRVAVQLRHAAICQTLDAGEVDDTPYIALEYIAGLNLREVQLRLADDNQNLDVEVASYIITEMLDALAYAHRHVDAKTGEALNLVHRDVSPHNLMLSFEGEVKLIDFGLAESSLKEEHTSSEVVLGKIAYMAPEQARGDDMDARADQYAAAVVAYELLSGERFFESRSTQQIWSMAGVGAFRPERFEALPFPVRNVLNQALNADPAKRFADCTAFRAAFAAAMVTIAPAAGRPDVRTIMQRIFADRIARDRQSIVDALSVAEQFTQQVRRGKDTQRYGAPADADPFAAPVATMTDYNTPSVSGIAGAEPSDSVTALAPAEATERVSAGELSSTAAAAQAAGLAPQRSRGALYASSFLVVVLGAIIVFLISTGNAADDVAHDAASVTVASTSPTAAPDAGRLAAAPSADAGRVATVSSTDAGKAVAADAQRTPPKRPKRPKRPKTDPARDDADARKPVRVVEEKQVNETPPPRDPVATTPPAKVIAPPKPPPVSKPKATVSALARVVMSCTLAGRDGTRLAKIKKLITRKGGPDAMTAGARPLVAKWAKKCGG